MKKAAILMATYNGEKYLKSQIDSIIGQSFKNWDLYIRDDASTDSTLKIINEYCELDSRIHLVSNNPELHGPYINFFSLIEYIRDISTYDFYFFCDQDDIWNPLKMEKMINTFNNKGIPELVYSDMTIIDSDGKISLESLNKFSRIKLENPLTIFFAHAYVWGCTVSINSELLNISPKIKVAEEKKYVEILSHDNYFAKIAVLYGIITFQSEQLVLYRRHGENVTTSSKFKVSLVDLISKSTLGFKRLCKTHARVYNQSLYLIKKINETKGSNDVTNELQTILFNGGLNGVIFLLKNKVKRNEFSRTIALYSIMFFKLYKKYLIVDMDVK